MYNRYIPSQSRYEAAGEERTSPRARHGPGGAGFLSGLLGERPSEGAGQAFSALLKKLRLDDLDAGDILLALIVLLLILEDGDDLDLIITLGLMILFSLGEK